MSPSFWKWAGIGLAALFVLALVTGGYLYVRDKDAQIADLNRQIAQKEIAIAQYEKILKTLKENIELRDAVLKDLYEEMLKAGISEELVRKFFEGVDLNALGAVDPSQVDELIARLEEDMAQCFEILSGGTVPRDDQTPNLVCPDLLTVK